MKRLSLDYLGDSHPASEPQYVEDHKDTETVKPETKYNWVWANGHIEISPHHEHDELADHAGVEDGHSGPIAVGTMRINMGQAIWDVDSNMSIAGLVKILKDYTKHMGLKWGGITDSEGEPVGQGSAFAPVKSYVYSFVDDHLYLASSEHRLGSQRAVMGRIEVEDGVATVDPSKLFIRTTKTPFGTTHDGALEAIQEWAEDEGYRLAGDFNMKTQPDLEMFNNSDPNPTAPQDHQYFNNKPEEQHVRNKAGVYQCPRCERLIPNWGEYRLHLDAHGPLMPTEEPRQDSGMASMEDLNSNIMEMEDGTTTAALILPVKNDIYAAFRDGEVIGYAKLRDGLVSHIQGQDQDAIRLKMAKYAASDPKDMIEGPVPFIFDVKGDKIVVGQPNTRTSDIEGSFTPGGIVEGTYEPGGKVYLRTSTNMPYTVRHMVELWYYQQPTLEVKNVFLVDEKGKNLKLANEGLTVYHGTSATNDQISNGLRPGNGTRGGAGAIYVSTSPNAAGNYGHVTEWNLNPGKILTRTLADDLKVWDDANAEAHNRAKAEGIPRDSYSWQSAAEKHRYDVLRELGYGAVAMAPAHDNTQTYAVLDPSALARKETKTAHAHDEGIGGYVKSMVAADPVAHTAYRALEHAGGEVYVVGGAVRDAVMGAEPKDIDLMVTGLPPEHVMNTLEKLPGRVDLTGKDFGVYRYRHGKNDVEIALPRREKSTGDKHTDFSVQADHTMNVEDDLLRRDFTANALAVGLRHGHLVDPFGGAQDIGMGRLRTITKSSLADDPLRIVRGLVANSRFGLVPDEETRNQMSENVHGLVHLPAERIHAELDKLISAKDPASAIRLAHETGALQYLLPEVDRAMGYDQGNKHHELDLGTHLLQVLDRTAQQTKDPDVRMAALLHDIGKPDSRWEDEDGQAHYYENERGQGANHETVGAEMAEIRLKQLKYPTARTQRVKTLIEGHMFPNFSTQKGARRFVQKWGDHADDLFKLRWADQGGKSEAAWDPTSNIAPMRELVEQARTQPTSQKDLAISGRDLIAIGMKPGPQMGLVLNSLTEAVLSDPELNHRDHLLEMAKSMVPNEKTAAASRTQMLNQAQQHESMHGPDQSVVHHQWPDGWSMRALQTYGDMYREGELMRNCFSPHTSEWTHNEWENHPQAWNYAGPDGFLDMNNLNAHEMDLNEPISRTMYSLRDPDNIPRVTVDPHHEDYHQMALGRHNSPLKPEYAQRLGDWAQQEAQHQDADPKITQFAQGGLGRLGAVKLSIEMPWGQDWDEWMATRPNWDAQGHQLGYDPEKHAEGKGFILKNGNIWTWPTHEMRPQHMEYKSRLRKNNLQAEPGTSFHITTDNGKGLVHFIGDGRGHDKAQRERVQEADPRLGYQSTPLFAMPAPPKDFGHARNLLDIFDSQDKNWREKSHGMPRRRIASVWTARYPGPDWHMVEGVLTYEG